MTTKSGLQSRQERDILFAQGGQIAANAAKSLSPSHSAKTSRNLLLELDHAHIPLSQIVVEWHPQVFQEAEESLLVFTQAIKQVTGRTLFGSSPCSRGSRCSWVGQIGLVKQAKAPKAKWVSMRVDKFHPIHRRE